MGYLKIALVSSFALLIAGVVVLGVLHVKGNVCFPGHEKLTLTASKTACYKPAKDGGKACSKATDCLSGYCVDDLRKSIGVCGSGKEVWLGGSFFDEAGNPTSWIVDHF